jgi:hypothetical protein
MHNFNDQAKTNPFCVTVLSVFVEVMDELCLEICQEVHRKIKTGNFCVNCDGNGGTSLQTSIQIEARDLLIWAYSRFKGRVGRRRKTNER